jgi:hypothetical protein
MACNILLQTGGKLKLQTDGYLLLNNCVVENQTDTHDLPIDHDTYRRYRKKLESVAKLAEQHHAKKYIKQAVKVAEIIENTSIDAPIIQQVADSVQNNTPIEIDFSLLSEEINKVISHFDNILQKRIMDMEADEEMIVLLMIQ